MSGCAAHLLPLDGARLLARHAEHVLAACQLDHLRDPVAGRVEGVEPFPERGDPRPWIARDGELHLLDALGRPSAAPRPPPAPGLTGEPGDVGEHLAERRWVERDHARLGGQSLCDGADVVERDRAHLADGLRDDQPHAELLEQLVVELIEGLAAARPFPHGGVDLGRLEVLRDHAARE